MTTTTELACVMPRAAPLKFKILRTRWKDECGGVVEGARVSTTRLSADELELLACELLRVAAECRLQSNPLKPKGGNHAL